MKNSAKIAALLAMLAVADASAALAQAPAPAAAPCTRKYGDPIPRGSPAAWITADDYPSSALRAELSATVKFRVNVGTTGRVEAVEILQVDGDPLFGAATSRVLTRRARFVPAVRACQPVPGEYEGVLRWTLPG